MGWGLGGSSIGLDCRMFLFNAGLCHRGEWLHLEQKVHVKLWVTTDSTRGIYEEQQYSGNSSSVVFLLTILQELSSFPASPFTVWSDYVHLCYKLKSEMHWKCRPAWKSHNNKTNTIVCRSFFSPSSISWASARLHFRFDRWTNHFHRKPTLLIYSSWAQSKRAD